MVELVLESQAGFILRNTVPSVLGTVVSWRAVRRSDEVALRDVRVEREMVLVEFGEKREGSHVTVVMNRG